MGEEGGGWATVDGESGESGDLASSGDIGRLGVSPGVPFLPPTPPIGGNKITDLGPRAPADPADPGADGGFCLRRFLSPTNRFHGYSIFSPFSPPALQAEGEKVRGEQMFADRCRR